MHRHVVFHNNKLASLRVLTFFIGPDNTASDSSSDPFNSLRRCLRELYIASFRELVA